MVKKLNAILLALLVILTMPILAFAEENNNTFDTSNNTSDETVGNTTINDDEVPDENDEGSLVNTGDNNITISDELEEEEEAEEEEETEIDENESTIINNPLGAQIRLLQLKKRIEIQIESANLIIENIESDNTSNVNTTQLNEFVEQFENLIVEIDNMNLEDETAENLAKTYVAIKNEAIKLTQDFKKIVGKAIREDRKEQLRARVQERKQLRTEAKDAKVQNLKKQYNAKKAQDILKNFANNHPELAEQVESGEITFEEAKAKIIEEYNSMTPEEQEETKAKLQEQKKEAKQEAIKKQKELQEQVKEKRKELAENFKERQESLKTRIQERKQKITQEIKQQKEEILKQRQENIEDKINTKKANKTVEEETTDASLTDSENEDNDDTN